VHALVGGGAGDAEQIGGLLNCERELDRQGVLFRGRVVMEKRDVDGRRDKRTAR
jgi:hypothetical protein